VPEQSQTRSLFDQTLTVSFSRKFLDSSIRTNGKAFSELRGSTEVIMAISADSAQRNCVISRKSTHVVHISSDRKYSIENVRLRPLTFLCYAAKHTFLTCQRSSSSQRYDNSLRNGHSAHKNAQLPSRKKNKPTAERTPTVDSETFARKPNISFVDSVLYSSIPCLPSVQTFCQLRSTLHPPRHVIVIKEHASCPVARNRLDSGRA
jgi:hypothetical protein